MKHVRIRVTSPSTKQQNVYEYRRHQILPTPSDPLGRHELLIEVIETGDSSLRKICLLVSEQKGTRKEMEELWNSTYKKAVDSGSLYTIGIKFDVT